MFGSFLGLNLTELKQVSVDYLSAVPDFLLHPRRTFSARFAHEAPFAGAVTFAAIMFMVGAAAATALNLTSKVDASSVAFIAFGMVAVWMMYAIFLHGFAWLVGARRGIKYTITTYFYVIGFLQPLLVVVLWVLTLVVPGAVNHQTIRGGLGGSMGAFEIASGNFFSFNARWLYRMIATLLILVYFSIGLAQAHQISLLRSFVASIGSFIFFLVFYLFILIIGNALGIESIVRTMY